ncbi:MAG: flagellar motor protein MotB [Pseudorhodobacter sp.]
MDGKNSAAPTIIKRKKIIAGGGHHGGAWKVAYADFVTAMMAFFLLMWLLNATTESQRKGLADYFSPSIPISRVSGGGDGAFGGDTIFAQEIRPQNNTGANGDTDGELQRQLEDIQSAFVARSGESMTMERMLRHVVTKVTDEGLVIELFDLEDTPLFEPDTAIAQPVTHDLTELLADILGLATNGIAVNGYVRNFPITLVDSPAWSLSAARAQTVRQLLTKKGLPADRMRRIAGHADRKPVTANQMAVRNNRVEVVLLRRDR